MKSMVKPTSVRLDVELLEELDQRCKKVGCSRNDFIKNSVELVIKNHTNFDFGDENEVMKISKTNEVNQSQGIKITDIVTGQTWIQDI